MHCYYCHQDDHLAVYCESLKLDAECSSAKYRGNALKVCSAKSLFCHLIGDDSAEFLTRWHSAHELASIHIRTGFPAIAEVAIGSAALSCVLDRSAMCSTICVNTNIVGEKIRAYVTPFVFQRTLWFITVHMYRDSDSAGTFICLYMGPIKPVINRSTAKNAFVNAWRLPPCRCA